MVKKKKKETNTKEQYNSYNKKTLNNINEIGSLYMALQNKYLEI